MPEKFEGGVPPQEHNEEEKIIERDRRINEEIEDRLLMASKAVLEALGSRDVTNQAGMEYYLAALDPKSNKLNSVSVGGKSFPTAPIRRTAAEAAENILKKEGLLTRTGYGDPETTGGQGSEIKLGTGQNSLEINPSFENIPNPIINIERISRGTPRYAGEDQISVSIRIEDKES